MKNNVVYAIESHPMDNRVTVSKNGIVQTLNARMGTGGGNTPLLLIQNDLPKQPNEEKRYSCYAINSHPMDCMIKFTGQIVPTITTKITKGSADGPLVLIRYGEET